VDVDCRTGKIAISGGFNRRAADEGRPNAHLARNKRGPANTRDRCL
jgi:hypothetical protein